MKNFMSEDFLLTSDVARELYHEFAEKMPIIDYHCHIDPREIAEDKKYENITRAWLGGDHYKWRAMRSNGVNERFITGDSTDYEKFLEWAKTLKNAIGNPLFHWAHLELKRYFGYDSVLNEETAPKVWEICNEKLKTLSVRDIIKQSNVKVICTTDDPIDSLEWHDKIKADETFDVKVLPAWRPDKAMNIENAIFCDYVKTLADISDTKIDSLQSLFEALNKRLDYFGERGCVATDHGLNEMVYSTLSADDVNEIFKKKLGGSTLTNLEVQAFKFTVLDFLAKEYAKRGWVMELHYGANRSVNSAMFEKLGLDTGFDCINGASCAPQMASFLNHMQKQNALAKTIIFSLNPTDDAIIGTVIGCFQSDEVRGKIQQGSAWWFNDTKTGMINQMTSLANLSLLGNFVGMLTDSRSFLSYTRHEYFRRILCELIGGLVNNGEYPYDKETLKELIQSICYNNAKNYFGF